MGNDARKKQRQRLKRQEKRRTERRATVGSPYVRIGNTGELVACYVNRHWHDRGMASIYVLRRVTGGGHVLAAFLVDIWCIGLKDAWGNLSITQQEFQESVLERLPAEMELARVDPDVVRRLVAGGIRFARQNGFRLPRHYQRWTALLGNLGNPETADLRDFGVDGGLRYVGALEDLRRRLVGSSAEAFLARPDVKYIIGPDDLYEPDEATAAVEEVTEAFAERVLDKVREWCFAEGRVPHPRLPDAIDLMAASMLNADSDTEGEDAANDVLADSASGNLDRFLEFESPQSKWELSAATAQLGTFTSQFRSSEEMFAALGLGELFDAE